MKEPQIGDIVYFVMKDGTIRPAIVTSDGSKINLKIFLDGLFDIGSEYSDQWKTSVPYSAERLPNTWHWRTARASDADGGQGLEEEKE